MILTSFAVLLWAIPLGAAIVALYILRMRRRDLKVPASFLWPERVDEIRANSLFQKLKFNWLMVLQILALLCLIFAFAGPKWKQEGLSGNVKVLVLDASASMAATDVAPSRFEAAKKIITDAMRSAGPGDRIALIVAGPSPRVAYSLTNDSAKYISLVNGLQCTDAESDMGGALRLASALVGAAPGAQIVVCSDGVFPPIEDFRAPQAQLTFRQVGERSRNLAITALGVSQTPSGFVAFVSVRNYGLDPMKANIKLLADGKLLNAYTVDAGSGKSWSRTFGISTGAKVIEAKLEADDFLASDNYAACLADTGSSIRTLIVGPGDLFVERALSLDPRVELFKAASVPASLLPSKRGESPFDLVVFDGVPEQPVNAPMILTLGSAGKGSPVRSSGSLRAPSFLRSDSDGIMAEVDLRSVFFESTENVNPVGSARVVAESSSGPLVVIRENPKKQVYVAASPLKSDWPLDPSFPIFFSNVLDWSGARALTQQLIIKSGQSLSLPSGGVDAVVRGPRGFSQETQDRMGNVTVRELPFVGHYSLSLSGKSRQIYSQLRSEVESQIDPKAEIRAGGTTVKAVRAADHFAEFWKPFLVLALCILIGEWWLFMRRS